MNRLGLLLRANHDAAVGVDIDLKRRIYNRSNGRILGQSRREQRHQNRVMFHKREQQRYGPRRIIAAQENGVARPDALLCQKLQIRDSLGRNPEPVMALAPPTERFVATRFFQPVQYEANTSHVSLPPITDPLWLFPTKGPLQNRKAAPSGRGARVHCRAPDSARREWTPTRDSLFRRDRRSSFREEFRAPPEYCRGLAGLPGEK